MSGQNLPTELDGAWRHLLDALGEPRDDVLDAEEVEVLVDDRRRVMAVMTLVRLIR